MSLEPKGSKLGRFEPLREAAESEKKPEHPVLKRLIDVGGSLEDLKKHFYPLLMLGVEDNQMNTAENITKMLAAALEEYERRPEHSVTYLRERAHDLIRALTPEAKRNRETKALRKDALDLWDEEYGEKSE